MGRSVVKRKTAATARTRRADEAKRRVDGRHCPVCLERLPSLGGRPAGRCLACGAQRAAERRCAKCHEDRVWEAGANAGCAACGHHGSMVKVFAGQEWLKES